MDFCICPPDDGLLYVEFPRPMDVVTFLLQQRWRGEPHLRTRHGYVPYYGGGVAFHFDALWIKGVLPTWYAPPTTPHSAEYFDKALNQLVNLGIYDDITDAAQHFNVFNSECEWVGPNNMDFSFGDIAFVWLNIRSDKKDPSKAFDLITQFLPKNIPIYEEEPPPQSDENPCK